MPPPPIAIDFGTTRTKMAYFDPDRNEPRLIEVGREVRPVVPSVFYLPLEGQGKRLVGDDAQEQVEIDPEGVVIGLKKDIHRLGKIRCGVGRASVGRVELASDLFAHFAQCREVFPTEEVNALHPDHSGRLRGAETGVHPQGSRAGGFPANHPHGRAGSRRAGLADEHWPEAQ